jgi:hypothetical protein
MTSYLLRYHLARELGDYVLAREALIGAISVALLMDDDNATARLRAMLADTKATHCE